MAAAATLAPSNRKVVAVFGGSFDPITLGHMNCIAQIMHSDQADEVWVVPCGNRPDKNLGAPALARYTMCNLAVETTFHQARVLVSDAELYERKPTLRLMRELQAANPQWDFRFVIGSDLLPGLGRWADAEALLAEVRFLVMPRPGYDMPPAAELPAVQYEMLQSPTGRFLRFEISSTEVRQRCEMGAEYIEGLVPHSVIGYVRRYGLYSAQLSPCSSCGGRRNLPLVVDGIAAGGAVADRPGSPAAPPDGGGADDGGADDGRSLAWEPV